MSVAKEEDEGCTALLQLRVKPSEKARIRDDADLAGLTMSEFLRRRALGRTVLAATDTTTVRELRRLGGLLKLVHTESGGAYSKETAHLLCTIAEVIDRLGVPK